MNAYRQDLVSRGYKLASIVHKLVVLRRFYEAREAGLRRDNPAAGVRAPKDRATEDGFHYLSEVDLALLLQALPCHGSESPFATALC